MKGGGKWCNAVSNKMLQHRNFNNRKCEHSRKRRGGGEEGKSLKGEVDADYGEMVRRSQQYDVALRFNNKLYFVSKIT